MNITLTTGELLEAHAALRVLIQYMLRTRRNDRAYKLSILRRYLREWTEPAEELRQCLIEEYGKSDGQVTRVPRTDEQYAEFKGKLDAIMDRSIALDLDHYVDLRGYDLSGLDEAAFEALTPLLAAWEEDTDAD